MKLRHSSVDFAVSGADVVGLLGNGEVDVDVEPVPLDAGWEVPPVQAVSRTIALARAMIEPIRIRCMVPVSAQNGRTALRSR